MSQNVTLQVKAYKSWKILRDFAQYSKGTLRQNKADSLNFFCNDIHVS